MTCAVPLATTGAPVALLLALGASAIAVGVLLIATTRGRVALVALPLLLLGLVATDNRQAVATDCALTITQTSTNTGLAPGIPPGAITAEITNHARESTVVVAVTVRISAVTKSPTARPGPCDASDYVLVAPRMPIGKVLAPGETVPFSGASVGFRDKPTDQDACQGAHVDLRYTSE
ncbi:hypothetical protein L6E12_04285 [Actinokineospora sp. PR83]|uniref:hypothetical protein n=1 Tax=Actinokineospora sp. PR83 TaxID=2884908 RepID=UPI001F2147DD|nr:hypothetical protein [Actinokineospora sp. PR83]MCG8915007.1 hypothetical protein [Actinokineospora sp. PR83]